jgi:hypothetical protein
VNEEGAAALMRSLKAAFPEAGIAVMPTRGLDSFYAERRGLIVSF